MSLAKFLAQHAPAAKKFLHENKGLLAAGAAAPAAIGAGYAAQPKIDDFMTDQAIESMKRKGKKGLLDAVNFAEEHPYVAATALGGAGLAGAGLGGEHFGDIFDTVSPVKVGGLMRRKEHERPR